jgi:hypothetical protein
MITTKHVLFVAVVIASAAFAGTAMAGKGGAGGNMLAPGQTGTNPGQTFDSDKGTTTALPPGQQFNSTREANPTIQTPPPGQTVINPGQKK